MKKEVWTSLIFKFNFLNSLVYVTEKPKAVSTGLSVRINL